MNPARFRCAAGCFLAIASALHAHSAESVTEMPQSHLGFFERYCYSCHDSATQKGSIDLETLSFSLETIETADLWQKVLNTLNADEMPPEDEEQLSEEERRVLVDWITASIQNAVEIKKSEQKVM